MYLYLCWPNPSHATDDIKFISIWVDKTPPIPAGSKCIAICVAKTHPMPARISNSYQHELTGTLPYQRGHKKHLNLFWRNPSFTNEDTKFLSTCLDQTPPLLARKQNVSQHVMYKPIPWQREHKCISKSINQSHPMPARTKQISEIMLQQPLSCQRGHKMHLNISWPSLFPGRKQNVSQPETTKPIPCHARTLVDWTAPKPSRTRKVLVNHNPHMPARTQNSYKHVLIKHIPCQRIHENYLMLASKRNVSQLVSASKPIRCILAHKMNLNMSRQKASCTWEHKICISICVTKTPPMPARTQDSP